MKFIYFFFLLVCCGCQVEHTTKFPLTQNFDPFFFRAKVQKNKSGFQDQQKLDDVMEFEAVKSEKLQLYQNGESFKPLLQILQNSQKFFFMNVLSFTCDAVTEPFVKLIEEKAKANTKVYLITNQYFSFLSYSCLQRLESAGVSILKTKTHSSYFLNDQQELLIGSQSVARMFFLADGFNFLDRDMMLYAKGPLALDALKDFISIWSEEKDESFASELAYRDAELQKLKGSVHQKDTNVCRFVTERPSLGITDIQKLWHEIIQTAESKITLSGVKIVADSSPLAQALKAKSQQAVEVHYIGNGYQGGNGELTMVLEEWIEALERKGIEWFKRRLIDLKVWDQERVARQNSKYYDALQKDSQIKIYAYYNFLHYKVWSIDNLGSFIGSANFDESNWGKVNEAGVFCTDPDLGQALALQLEKDRLNSWPYEKVFQ